MVVGDILRLLHDGVNYAVIAADLGDLSVIRAVSSRAGQLTRPRT
jgi:hypothetical protein